MSLFSICGTHTIRIERSTPVKDTSGGIIRDNWAAVAGWELLSATVQPISSRERFTFAQRNIYLSHRVYVPGKLEVKAQDRVVVLNSFGEVDFYIIIKGVFNEAGRHVLTMIEGMEQSK